MTDDQLRPIIRDVFAEMIDELPPSPVDTSSNDAAVQDLHRPPTGSARRLAAVAAACLVLAGGVALFAVRRGDETAITTPSVSTPPGDDPAAGPAPTPFDESRPATPDTADGEGAIDGSPFTVDLGGVVPASVPIVLAEHLGSVAQAVRAAVGDAVFGGSAVQNGDQPDITMTIYGTDLDAISTALSRVDTAYRDRLTVVETTYSVSDIETFAAEAHRRLDDAGIDAMVLVQFGLDAVAVHLQTPDGEPDERLEADVLNLLEDIPVVISFTGPVVPYNQVPAPEPTG